jgi:hypothetical protein
LSFGHLKYMQIIKRHTPVWQYFCDFWHQEFGWWAKVCRQYQWKPKFSSRR